MNIVNKKLFCIIEIILIISGIILYLFPINEYSPLGDSISMNALGELKNDETIELPFVVSTNTIDSIGFTFVTYCQKNKDGFVNVEIYSDDNRLLNTQKISLSDISDNQQFNFYFEKQKKSLGKVFKVVLKTSDFNDNTKLSFLVNNTNDDKLKVIINGIKFDYSLSYSIGGDIGNRLYSWYLFMISSLVFCFYSINYKEEK